MTRQLAGSFDFKGECVEITLYSQRSHSDCWNIPHFLIGNTSTPSGSIFVSQLCWFTIIFVIPQVYFYSCSFLLSRVCFLWTSADLNCVFTQTHPFFVFEPGEETSWVFSQYACSGGKDVERRTGQRDQTQWLQNEPSPRRDLGHAEKEEESLGFIHRTKKHAPKKVSGTYPGGSFLSLIGICL